ncbi:uncharacterized protein LOC143998267 [Lithobates pipiens]
MSDEEYSFLAVKRSSWKIQQTMKHSTPLTTCTYMSSLPTVNELEEDGYRSNCSTVKENYECLKESTDGTAQSQINQERIVQDPSHCSPHEITNKKNQIAIERIPPSEITLTVTPEQETALNNRNKPSRMKTFSRYSKIKKQRKLLMKEKVDTWVIQQLRNIEEAAHHNLEVEYV